MSVSRDSPSTRLHGSDNPDDGASGIVYDKGAIFLRTIERIVGRETLERRHPRIDVGHVVRIGQDPVPMIEKYKDRLYDMHLKDVDKAEAKGSSVEIGRGIIDIPMVIRTLKKIDYQGCMALEYEKDGDDPVPGLAESVGYVRGVARLV